MMKNPAKHTGKVLRSLLKYFTAALLIFIPLYPKFPLFILPFTYVAIRAEDFLIVIAVLISLIYFLKHRFTKFPPLTPQILIFWAVGLVSCISAILITKNVNPMLVILHYFRRIEYMSLFFVFYLLGSFGHQQRRFATQLIFLPVVGVFFYGLAQIHLKAPVISTMNAEFSKGLALTLQPGVQLSSTFSGHYDLAIYLTFIISFFAALIMLFKDKAKQGMVIVSLLPSIWLFSQAGSRMGLIGLLIAVAFITYLTRRYFIGFILFVLIGVGVVSSPHLMGRFQNVFKIIPLTRQSSITSITVLAQEEVLRPIQQDRSASIRLDVEWPRAMRSFYKNPLLGTGYSSLDLATDNDYLRTLGEVGLLGILSFLSILVGLFTLLLKRFRQAKHFWDRLITTASLGVFASMTSIAVFIDVFEASKIALLFWSIMGLALSASYDKD